MNSFWVCQTLFFRLSKTCILHHFYDENMSTKFAVKFSLRSSRTKYKFANGKKTLKVKRELVTPSAAVMYLIAKL